MKSLYCPRRVSLSWRRLVRLYLGALIVVAVKFLCWIWSRSVKNSGVQALAQDAMNDVVFKYFFYYMLKLTS